MERSLWEPERIKFGAGEKRVNERTLCVCVCVCVCLSHTRTQMGWKEGRYHVKFRYEIIWRCEMGRDRSVLEMSKTEIKSF